MSFRFLHTADWQLGKPFGQFDSDLASLLRNARLGVIGRLAALALEEGASHVVVAGDVWDQETPSDSTIRHPLEALREATHVQWWLLPGNHDPARPNGLWTRLAAIGMPSNVRPLLNEGSIEAAPGVWLLSAPWTSKNPGMDLTSWMDDYPTPEGALRIGVAHGSTVDFTEEAQSCVIDPRRAELAHLDYLALGDWHGQLRLNARTWYAGTPEPDRFKDNSPGGCLVIDIESRGAVPKVERRETSTYRWISKQLDFPPDMEPEAVMGQVDMGDFSRRHILANIAFTGTISLSKRARLQQLIEIARGGFAWFNADLANLGTLVEAGDLAALEGGLRDTAHVLTALADDTERSAQERRDARRALDYLFTFAGQGAEATP